ncbi:hypothetical protein CYLTODRAFT_427766 [Cylindrobasidium torrendii FP15055 ss-10]|uniref:F-box domain-containing protein n=1 Tax=Cylindrobasidium torrendii FP15055 ss-10 TaxID=1314674 RepID=A0A0D7AR49_9AGAR|nr:hypothetical protein CYLTODRAFT_427766 [Cylindrobasidium torrendii FP15055 ss-10]
MSAVTLFSLPTELLTTIFEEILDELPQDSWSYYGQRAKLLLCSRRFYAIICNRATFWSFLTVERCDIENVVLGVEGSAPIIPASLLFNIKHARGPVNLFISAWVDTDPDAKLDDKERDELDIETGKKLDVILGKIFADLSSRLVSLKVDEDNLLGCGARIMRAIRAHPPLSLKSLAVVTANGSYGEWEEDATLGEGGYPTDQSSSHSQTDGASSDSQADDVSSGSEADEPSTDPSQTDESSVYSQADSSSDSSQVDTSVDHSKAPIPALRSLEMQGVMNNYWDQCGNIWNVATLAEVTFRDTTPPPVDFLWELVNKNPELRRISLYDSFSVKRSSNIPAVFAGVQDLQIGVSSPEQETGAFTFMKSAIFPDLKHLTLMGEQRFVIPLQEFIDAASAAFPLDELTSLHLHSAVGIDPFRFPSLKRLRVSGFTLRRKWEHESFPFDDDLNLLREETENGEVSSFAFPALETLEIAIAVSPKSTGWMTELRGALYLISGRADCYMSYETIPCTLRSARIFISGIQSPYVDAPTPKGTKHILSFIKESFDPMLKAVEVAGAEDIPFSVECVFLDEDKNWRKIVDLKALA